MTFFYDTTDPNSIAFIRHIQRPLREKIVIGILMGLGVLAMIAGIVKIVLFHKAQGADAGISDLTSVRLWM